MLAVVEALKARHPDIEFLYVGSRGSERSIVESAGLPFRAIRAGKFRRYGSDWWKDPEQLWANAKDVLNLKLGVIQSLLIIRRFKPSVVLAKGGYVSLPVGIAAWALRVPLVIHETDLVMGLANRILSRLATRVAVPVDRGVDPKFVETGNPIRSELFTPQSHDFFTGESELPTVLVTGGSQGARALNRAVFDSLEALLQFTRVIHLTGEQGAQEAGERTDQLPENLRDRYAWESFLTDEYAAALQQADLLVTRAGGTLWEAAALGKPSIIVPLPHSAGDHQRANARAFESEGAGVLIEQADFDPERLVGELKALLADPARLQAMGAAARVLARPDAAARLAEAVIGSAQGRPR